MRLGGVQLAGQKLLERGAVRVLALERSGRDGEPNGPDAEQEAQGHEQGELDDVDCRGGEPAEPRQRQRYGESGECRPQQRHLEIVVAGRAHHHDDLPGGLLLGRPDRPP